MWAGLHGGARSGARGACGMGGLAKCVSGPSSGGGWPNDGGGQVEVVKAAGAERRAARRGVGDGDGERANGQGGAAAIFFSAAEISDVVKCPHHKQCMETWPELIVTRLEDVRH